MIFLIFLIFLYSIIYLAVYVLAHQNANMIKPLIGMTGGMILLLFITCALSFVYGYWYIGIIVAFVIIGMIRFFLYLNKY